MVTTGSYRKRPSSHDRPRRENVRSPSGTRSTREPILAKYGADAVRWFMLVRQPARTRSGVVRSRDRRRFAIRAAGLAPGDRNPLRPRATTILLKKKLNRTIAAVGEAIDGLQFNKAIAHLYELTTAIEKAQAFGRPGIEAIRALVLLVSPAAPHLGEECWAALGESGLIADAAWPGFDPALLVDDRLTLAVQVNGKLRDTLSAPRGMDRSEVEALALASANVQRQLAGSHPRKIIVVPDRLVNIVA